MILSIESVFDNPFTLYLGLYHLRHRKKRAWLKLCDLHQKATLVMQHEVSGSNSTYEYASSRQWRQKLRMRDDQPTWMSLTVTQYHTIPWAE